MNKKYFIILYYIKMKIAYIVLLLAISSIVSETKATEFENLENAKNILTANHVFDEAGDALFSYELNSGNFLLSIHSTWGKQLSITCILGNKESDFDKSSTNICPVLYETSDFKVTNIIFSLTDDEVSSGKKLFLKISVNKVPSDGVSLDLFIREKAFKTKLTTQTLENSFAYTAIEFNAKDYVNKDYLLTASEKQGLLVYGGKGDSFKRIDETSILPITEQTLASYLLDLENIIILAGTVYDKESENTLSIHFSPLEDEKVKIAYYTGINEEYYVGSINTFHSECTLDSITNYLIVNYRALEAGDYYFKFNDYVGPKITLADLPPGTTDLSKLDYSPISRANSLNRRDFATHVFNLPCTDGSKIIANLLYTKKNLKTKGEVSPIGSGFVDYSFVFDGDNQFKITYSAAQYQFALAIFTPDSDDKENFNVKFEGKTIGMDNKDKHIFTRTDDSSKDLIITADKDVEALISFSFSEREKPDPARQQLYTLTTYIDEKGSYFYYEMEHEYDTNYYVDVVIDNPSPDALPFCYYLATTIIIQNTGHNCILLPALESTTLTFNKIFKYSGKDDYNVEEPAYNLIMYNNHSKFDYSIKEINIRTDLEQSIPINETSAGRTSVHLETDLEKDKASYYNIFIGNMTEDFHFDVYILDEDTSAFKEPQLDIECVYAFEVGVKFVEKFFTEENNKCLYINKDDYTSNVSHIQFSGIKMDTNEKLIIKVTPKKDMKVRFLFNKYEYVNKIYDFKDIFGEGIHVVEDPSIYKIFEINKADLEKVDSETIMFYDRDKIGMEFYARKGKEFTKVYDKGGLVFFNIRETLTAYSGYDKLLFIVGKNDCEKVYCGSQSKYQVRYFFKAIYKETEGLTDYFRLPVSIQNCVEGKNYFVILKYNKKFPEDDSVYLGRYELLGKIALGHYIDTFVTDEYDKAKILLTDIQKLNDNDYHLDIFRLACENNLLAYFDYFTQSKASSFGLNEGEVKFFVIPKGENYTFNYNGVDKLKIDLVGDKRKKDPEITFEGNRKNIKNNAVNLSRRNADINDLFVAAPSSEDAVIRISPLISLDKMKKESADNVYSYNGFLVYDIPQNSKSILVVVTRKGYRLRLLSDSSSGIKVCYNLAETIILTKVEGSCFYLVDKYELKYDLPDETKKYYLTLYPMDDSQTIAIEKTKAYNKEGGESDGGDGVGGNWLIIIIVIIAVIIVIFIILFIVIHIRKKRVSSTDIDTVKQPSPLTN